MLKALDKRKGEVLANETSRGEEFTCAGCKALLTLRRGQIKIPHFAHRPSVFCAWGAGESQAHLQAKMDLRDFFRSRNLRAEVEVEVLNILGDRRADVMVWSLSSARYAIELQHSSISESVIAERTRAYLREGIRPLWVKVAKPTFLDNLE